MEEKKLTEQVRKYCVLYDKSHKGHMEKGTVNSTWNEIAKTFEFLVNGKIISSNVRTPISQNTSQWLLLNLVSYRSIPGLGEAFFREDADPTRYVKKSFYLCENLVVETLCALRLVETFWLVEPLF